MDNKWPITIKCIDCILKTKNHEQTTDEGFYRLEYRAARR